MAPERIAEAYFFPSIRQGQMETGAAVIAAWPAPAPDAAPATDGAVAAAEPASDTAPRGRTEVFTAVYQWTRKGPDRGKWVVDVVTQADAPLATVETVVRGVQERAGEALDAHRMDGDAVRAVLAAPSVAW